LGAGTTVLTDGVPVAGTLDAVFDANCEFQFTPLGGATHARFTMTLATSDFDLYVKRGSAPTTADWECRPFFGGTATEICELPVNGQDHFAMVRRFSGSGDFTITALSVTPPPTCSLGPGTHVLAEGVPVTASLTDASGALCEFEFTPAAGSDIGSITMSPATSDFDLYVKRGSAPTTTDWECRPFSGGTTTETCNLLTNGQTFYAMVRRFGGSGDFTIVASSATVPELGNGVPTPLTVATGQQLLYKAVVPAGSSHLTVAIAGEPGAFVCAATGACSPSMFTDADLYVSYEDVPTTSSYDCQSWAYGNVDSCSFSFAFDTVGDPVSDPVDIEPYLGAGRYFIVVRGFDGPADVLLTGLWV